LFIAALHQEKAVMVDFTDGVKRLPILKDSNGEESIDHNAVSTPTPSTSNAAGGQIQWTLVVTFDRHGKKIYAGTNRGYINIIDTETRTVRNQRGHCFLTNWDGNLTVSMYSEIAVIRLSSDNECH